MPGSETYQVRPNKQAFACGHTWEREPSRISDAENGPPRDKEPCSHHLLSVTGGVYLLAFKCFILSTNQPDALPTRDV